MDVPLNLTPELGHRLQRAARKHGVSADEYTLRLLDRHVPGDGQAAALVSLLQSWIDKEDDAREQREAGAYLVRALDDDRSVRPSVVPDRAQGRHLVSLVVALDAGPPGLVTNPKRPPESLLAPSGFRRSSQPVRVSFCRRSQITKYAASCCGVAASKDSDGSMRHRRRPRHGARHAGPRQIPGHPGRPRPCDPGPGSDAAGDRGATAGYSLLAPGMTELVRVTTDAAYYEEDSDSVELWSPGNLLFTAPDMFRTTTSRPPGRG